MPKFIAELLERVREFCRAVEECHDFELPLRDRAGLVAEQQIQTAGCFDAADLPHEHVVFQHLAHVLRRDDCDHQRQTFRHRHDDDDHRQHNRFDERVQQIHPIGAVKADARHVEAVLNDDALKHECNRNRHAADIAELTDLLGEIGELQFQRRIAIFIQLQLACDFAVKSIVAERRRAHDGIAARHHRAAKHLVVIQKIGTRGGFGIVRVVRRRNFCLFLRLAVED